MTIVPKPPYDSGENLLALCIWREARGCPYEAKLGVAWTIRNRCDMAPAQGFKHTADENVLKPYAFSSFNVDDPQSFRYPEPGPTWDDCLRAAREGMDPDNSVQPAAFYRVTFYYSFPLTEPPKGWGPVLEASCIGGLHFCVLSAIPTVVT